MPFNFAANLREQAVQHKRGKRQMLKVVTENRMGLIAR
jgi:hypothetical protein